MAISKGGVMKSAGLIRSILVIILLMSCTVQHHESRCRYRTRQYTALIAGIEGNTIMFDIDGLTWAYSLKGLRSGAYGTPVPGDVSLQKNKVYVITRKELVAGKCKAELIVSIVPR